MERLVTAFGMLSASLALLTLVAAFFITPTLTNDQRWLANMFFVLVAPASAFLIGGKVALRLRSQGNRYPLLKTSITATPGLLTLLLAWNCRPYWYAPSDGASAPSAAAAPAPLKMSAGFNVAVPGFVALDAAPDDGLVLSHRIQRFLERDLEPLAAAEDPTFGPRLDPLVWGPDKVPPLGYAPPDRWEPSPEQLATSVNANALVYGVLTHTARETIFTPAFVLRNLELQDAWELTGRYQLGRPITRPGVDALARDQVGDELEARLRWLPVLNRATLYANRQDYAAAQTLFLSVATTSREPGPAALFYHFAANMAGLQGQYTEADQLFDQAVAADPAFLRAKLGKVEVQFQNAMGDCEDHVRSVAGVRAAIDAFLALGQVPYDQSPDIPAKVAYGVGRAYLCLAQAGVDGPDYWELARSQFQVVIDGFAAGNPRLQGLAADSYADRAIIELPVAGEPPGGERIAKLRTALGSWCQAIALSRIDRSQTTYLDNLGPVVRELGAGDSAVAACAATLGADPGKQTRFQHLLE